MFNVLAPALWEGPGWAEALIWVALAAGLQGLILHMTREKHPLCPWLTLLPVFLILLAGLASLLCFFSSFFSLETALLEQNLLLGIFAFLGMFAPPLLFAVLLPRAGLYLLGWLLGLWLWED